MSGEPELGKPAPDFRVATTEGDKTLRDLLGDTKLVLAFYVEDATPACTSEVVSFKEEYKTIQELSARVLGVSADTIESHKQFAQKLGGLPFSLASDANLSLARAYGVLGDDGKRSRRAVFVIAADGKLTYKNTRYNPGNPGHYMELFEALGLKT